MLTYDWLEKAVLPPQSSLLSSIYTLAFSLTTRRSGVTGIASDSPVRAYTRGRGFILSFLRRGSVL